MNLNYQDFQKAIQELETFYGGNVLNGGILEKTWYDALSRISVEDLNYAVAQCFRFHPRQYNYFPSPEDLRKLAFDAQENHQSSQIFQVDTLQLPPENDQEAVRRNLISRLYLNYWANGRVRAEHKEEFHQKFSNHSIEELQRLIDIEVHQRGQAKGVKADDAITPEGREYTEKLSQLIRGKTL